MKHIISKKGFTMVELCIVIAIAAIVATMITTTVILTSGQKEGIQREAAFISEVTDIQIRTNTWLKKYDNTNHTLSVVERDGISTLIATDDTTHAESTLTFSDASLKDDGEAMNSYKNVVRIDFELSKGIDENNPEASVVVLTVIGQKGSGSVVTEQNQTLLFPLFSDLTRQRIVDGKGQWK